MPTDILWAAFPVPDRAATGAPSGYTVRALPSSSEAMRHYCFASCGVRCSDDLQMGSHIFAAGAKEWHLSLDCKLSPPGLFCCCLSV